MSSIETIEAPKVSLSDWARTQFARPPHIATLRKWAREKLIKPVPELVGREYVVNPAARYVGKAK